MMKQRAFRVAALLLLFAATTALAQPPGFGGPGGFGPPGGEQRKILKEHDKNGDGWLNAAERKVAREAMKNDGGGRRGPGGGFGPPGGFGRGGETPKPGPKVHPADATNFATATLYDPTVLRTIFIEFESADWEKELEDFHGTDVDVPAKVVVDGKTFNNVGIHFRGMSSYMMVRAGSKRSMNLTVDMADAKQRIHGAKTLNLLNNHEDATAMSTVIYSHIARQYIPAPKANFAKVVINGESWGIYTNVQQFNKDFAKENFQNDKGARWKVRGNPGGAAGLEYLGENVADYKRRYEIKSKDDAKSWKALIQLCKTLNETPADKLEDALKPMLDVEGLLWFLALDVVLINNDGFWVRASDYSIYLDEKGKFHFIPHDMNEAFHAGMGPGGGGGRGGMPKPGELFPIFLQDVLQLTDAQKTELAKIQKETDTQLESLLTDEQKKQWKEMRNNTGRPPGGGFGPPGGGGMELDPLVGLTDVRKPLRSKILAVPSLKAKYLADVKTIAEKSLDWNNLGPIVALHRKVIEAELKIDTRKLEPFEAFARTTADAPEPSKGREMSLRSFAEQRRKYLLNYAEKPRP